MLIRGRTLDVLIGIGDTERPAPIPGRQLANPAPSSPIFSSVLEVHFSAAAERTTAGFALSLADHSTLAAGGTVTLSHGASDT